MYADLQFRIYKFINEYILLLFTKIGKEIYQNSKQTQKSAFKSIMGRQVC